MTLGHAEISYANVQRLSEFDSTRRQAARALGRCERPTVLDLERGLECVQSWQPPDRTSAAMLPYDPLVRVTTSFRRSRSGWSLTPSPLPSGARMRPRSIGGSRSRHS